MDLGLPRFKPPSLQPCNGPQILLASTLPHRLGSARRSSAVVSADFSVFHVSPSRCGSLCLDAVVRFRHRRARGRPGSLGGGFVLTLLETYYDFRISFGWRTRGARPGLRGRCQRSRRHHPARACGDVPELAARGRTGVHRRLPHGTPQVGPPVTTATAGCV